jgi:hypothetical protein
MGPIGPTGPTGPIAPSKNAIFLSLYGKITDTNGSETAHILSKDGKSPYSITVVEDEQGRYSIIPSSETLFSYGVVLPTSVKMTALSSWMTKENALDDKQTTFTPCFWIGIVDPTSNIARWSILSSPESLMIHGNNKVQLNNLEKPIELAQGTIFMLLVMEQKNGAYIPLQSQSIVNASLLFTEK